jgi:hypothetical protein
MERPSPAETTEALARATIRAEITKFTEREHELTERAAALCAAGRGGSGPPISERDRAVRERARNMLNGHGSLMPSLPTETSEAEILAEREAVRLVLATLQRADVEAATIQAAQWAQAHAAEWRSVVRDWAIAARRFEAVEARAQAFLESAGDARHALPLSWLPIGTGAEVDLYCMSSVDEVLAKIVEDGAATRSDLKRAQAEGGR